MTIYLLTGHALAILLPILPALVSIALLRRAVRAVKTPWFSLSASAMVFGLSAIWLSKSGTQVITSILGPTVEETPEWVSTIYRAGPPMSIALIALAGGFWVYLKIRKI